MDSQKPYVITIVGAESSGKTLLASSLAKYLNAPYVPEYAREYLSNLTRQYNKDDLHNIAVKEIQSLSAAIAAPRDFVSPLLKTGGSGLLDSGTFEKLLNFIKSKITNQKSEIVLVDGGMLTLRMWARIKFGIEIEIVERALSKDVTDLYLLCRPLPDWEPDPLREAPQVVDRCWIYNQYLKELIHAKKKFEIVDMNR